MATSTFLQAPLKDLMRLTLSMTSVLNATAFIVIPNDKCTLERLTTQELISQLEANREAWKDVGSSKDTASRDEAFKALPVFPLVLGISTSTIDRPGFHQLIGSDAADYTTETLSGYLLYSLMKD